MKSSNLFKLFGIGLYTFAGISALAFSAKSLNAPMLVIQEYEENFLKDPAFKNAGTDESKIRSYLQKNAKYLNALEVKKYSRVINKFSKKYQLPAGLILSVIRVESNFRTWAVSPKGAVGLMQIMPDTGEWIAKKMGIAWNGSTLLFDPEINLTLGVYYLNYLRNKYDGNLFHMLSAYNRGPAKVDLDVASGREFNSEYYEKVRQYLPKMTLARQ